MTPTYAFRLGRGPVLDAHRDGTPLTLVDALRAVRGVGHAEVLRLTGDDRTWTPVVRDAGSAVVVVHAPTGRRVHRRPCRRAVPLTAEPVEPWHLSGDGTP